MYIRYISFKEKIDLENNNLFLGQRCCTSFYTDLLYVTHVQIILIQKTTSPQILLEVFSGLQETSPYKYYVIYNSIRVVFSKTSIEKLMNHKFCPKLNRF